MVAPHPPCPRDSKPSTQQQSRAGRVEAQSLVRQGLRGADPLKLAPRCPLGSNHLCPESPSNASRWGLASNLGFAVQKWQAGWGLARGSAPSTKEGRAGLLPGRGRRPTRVPHARSLCTALGRPSTAAAAICCPWRWTWLGSDAHRPAPDALSCRTRVLALLLLSRRQADLGSTGQGPPGF